MNPTELVVALTRHIRDSVRPHLGTLQSRRVSGKAASGDATFAIDDVAEEAIVQFIEKNRLSIAYYSEDKGLVEFGASPEFVLVIDPIDGTRPAAAGFEACVVSVACADYRKDAVLGDVRYGCIGEIKTDDLYVAERGRGAVRYDAAGAQIPFQRLPIEEIAAAPMTFEVVARPMEWLAVVLGEIIDAAALRGGVFLLSSTAFSLTRLVTGQLAASMDVGNRILRDYPQSHARFAQLGGGRALALNTYDIAAAGLIAREAGAIVTDAYGNSHDAVPLLDTSESNLTSILAASNPVLHERLLAQIDAGIGRLRIDGD